MQLPIYSKAAHQATSEPPASLTLFDGIWMLDDSFDKDEHGNVKRSRGSTPQGMLVYDSRGGRMTVQVMNDGRPSVGICGEEPAEQIKAAFKGYTAYFGSFEVNEQEHYVLHHMEGSLVPTEVGATRKRFYEFSGNRITLTTPPFVENGELRVRHIVWRRAGFPAN